MRDLPCSTTRGLKAVSAVNLGSIGLVLCFSALMCPFPSLLNLWYLANCCFIQISVLFGSCFRWRVNLAILTRSTNIVSLLYAVILTMWSANRSQNRGIREEKNSFKKIVNKEKFFIFYQVTAYESAPNT